MRLAHTHCICMHGALICLELWQSGFAAAGRADVPCRLPCCTAVCIPCLHHAVAVSCCTATAWSRAQEAYQLTPRLTPVWTCQARSHASDHAIMPIATLKSTLHLLKELNLREEEVGQLAHCACRAACQSLLAQILYDAILQAHNGQHAVWLSYTHSSISVLLVRRQSACCTVAIVAHDQ